MNVLVTGGLGYLGSHVVVELFNKNHNVIIYDNLSNSSMKVLKNLEKILGGKMTFFKGDILDKAFLSKIIKENQINAVFHFAGLKSVKDSNENKKKYYEVNVEGTGNLVESMQENIEEDKYFIFSSSACIYGDPLYLPYDESHPLKPENYYGETKLLSEELLKVTSKNNKKWKICALRYFNPIGSHSSCLIGDNPKSNLENLMPKINFVAKNPKEKLKIFGSDYNTTDGTAVRDYIHVCDLIDGHISAFEYLMNLKSPFFDIFNLGRGKGVSVMELVKVFEKVNDVRIPYQFIQRRPGDLPSYFADIRKSSKLLKWKPTRNLEDMCLSAWKFQELKEKF